MREDAKKLESLGSFDLEEWIAEMKRVGRWDKLPRVNCVYCHDSGILCFAQAPDLTVVEIGKGGKDPATGVDVGPVVCNCSAGDVWLTPWQEVRFDKKLKKPKKIWVRRSTMHGLLSLAGYTRIEKNLAYQTIAEKKLERLRDTTGRGGEEEQAERLTPSEEPAAPFHPPMESPPPPEEPDFWGEDGESKLDDLSDIPF